MNATETIFVYNENCVMAGQQVSQSRVEQSSDPENCWDWSKVELTEEQAAGFETRGQWGRKVARTIRKAMAAF